MAAVVGVAGAASSLSVADSVNAFCDSSAVRSASRVSVSLVSGCYSCAFEHTYRLRKPRHSTSPSRLASLVLHSNHLSRLSS